jgi:hypothetical protein
MVAGAAALVSDQPARSAADLIAPGLPQRLIVVVSLPD